MLNDVLTTGDRTVHFLEMTLVGHGWGKNAGTGHPVIVAFVVIMVMDTQAGAIIRLDVLKYAMRLPAFMKIMNEIMK